MQALNSTHARNRPT